MRDDLNEGGVLGPSGNENRTSARRFEPAPAAEADVGGAASRRGSGAPGGKERRTTPRYRMPAEWEPHEATWIAWPHHEPDWPGKLEPIPWVYAEIARALAAHEVVEILCQSEEVADSARRALAAHAVPEDRVRLHHVPTDRVWLRDSAPTGAIDESGRLELVNWAFNAWAKYDNWQRDAGVGKAIESIVRAPRHEPTRGQSDTRVVLEGGGFDVNGSGLV